MPSLLPLLLPFVPGSGSSTPVTGPTYALEVAWADTPKTASPTWTDMTVHVRASAGLAFQRGRSNEQDPQAQPGRASWEFINDTGDFTMGNGSSPYAPLQIRRPVRIRATYGSATYTLWQGFIDSWENASDDTMGYVRVSASDRLARAAGVTLRGFIEGEVLQDSPSGYWPLSESADATSASDLAAGDAPRLVVAAAGSGGVVDFGAGVSPGPEGTGVVAFTPVSSVNYSYLSGSSPVVFGGSSASTVSCFVKFTSTATMYPARLGWGFASLAIIASAGVVAGVTVNDGEWHHVAVTRDDSTLTTMTYVDGSLAYTGSYPFPRGSFSILTVGEVFDGQIAHVAVFPTVLSPTRIEAQAIAGVTSAAGETSNVRFTRHCAAAGLPSTHYASSTGLATMDAQPVRGVNLLDALRQCAEAEGGVVFVDREGVLTFAPRSARYGAAVAVTLDAQKAGQVGTDFTYTTDDVLLLNDVTVSRVNGSVQRVVDAASVDAYETRSDSVTLYVDSDSEARGAAEWRVYAYSVPQPRGSQLDVDVIGAVGSGVSATDLLPVDIGHRVNVVNLPPDVAASSTADLFVEGIAWRIDGASARLTLTTSPVGAAGAVFIFDDATYGVFDGPGRFAY